MMKTYQLTYIVELTARHDISETLLHELLTKALQQEAGMIGYLIGDKKTELTTIKD